MKTSSRTLFVLATGGLAIALAFAGTLPGPGQSPSENQSARTLLDQAVAAHARHDIATEYELLLGATSAPGSDPAVAEAWRRLARLDWKFHKRHDRARQRLATAESLGDGLAETHLERVRVDFDAGDFQSARQAIQRAAAAAASDTHRRQAQLLSGTILVEEATLSRLTADGGFDAVPARGVFERLAPVVRDEPGDLQTARVVLNLALLLEEGPAIVPAWRSYFHAAGSDEAPNLVRNAGRTLESIAARWDPQHPLSLDDRRRLVQALADSRLFREAALLALDPAAGAGFAEIPAVAEIVGYARFCEEVGSITREHYRRTALEEGSPSNYRDQLAKAARDLWPRLQGTDSEAPTSAEWSLEAKLTGELARFGIYFSLTVTAGYYDLHMGHSVVDITRKIKQYGSEAELRFIALDSMVSNGFQSWAWRTGQHGGWNKPGIIYQVRSAYAGGPLRAWRLVTSEGDRTGLLAEIERETSQDDHRATRNPTGYLPGLRLRLLQQGRHRLLERLRARGLSEERLRLAFLEHYRTADLESSIFAHEGRHALDKQGWNRWLFNESDGEFNAKLSEVAFAPEPRLALGSIFSDNIGSPTPHGQANQRIMQGLLKWMQENSGRLSGLDPQRPLLPQFDKLTDAQIKAAFRSLDSMAR